MVEEACAIKLHLAPMQVPLIINDRVDVAVIRREDMGRQVLDLAATFRAADRGAEAVLRERGKEAELGLVREITDMVRVSYVRQREALGLGHAILQARDLVGDEPFAVMLSDDIIDSKTPALRQLLDVYQKYDAPVLATMEVEGEAISRFGALEVDEVEDGVYRIKDMVEKPPLAKAPSNLAIIGRYILTPDIFDEITNTTPGAIGEIQITDAMRALLRKRDFYAVRFEGTRYDAGDKLGFLIATVEFALKHKDLAPEFRQYLKSFKPS